jgi:hypothetical protein
MITMSRTTSEQEMDSQKLRIALDLIITELSVPFLEKRARSKSHKKTPIEELNAVIQELTGREKELQAATGIAKMLLDRNDELNDTRKALYTKKHHYKSICKHQEKDIETLGAELRDSKEKLLNVCEMLNKAEEEKIQLVAENKRIVYEQSLKQEPLNLDTAEDLEREIYEMKAKFKEQYDSLTSNSQ